MKTFILSLMAFSLLAFTACDTAEPPIVEETPEMIEEIVEESSADYSFDLPEDYTLHSTDYDNYVPGDGDTVTDWYGTQSGIWTTGFYLRISNSSAYEFVKNDFLSDPFYEDLGIDASTLIEEGTETINGIEMNTFIHPTAIGYDVKYYFFEMDGRHYEFQVSDWNETAKATIESFQFL